MFTMCRLCVYQQTIQLNQPFVVDEDSGDFVTLDPTVCPQCKRPGAFRENQLPQLSDEMKKAVEDETRQRRDGEIKRRRDQALRLLESAPYMILGDHPESLSSEELNQFSHERRHARVKIIAGGISGPLCIESSNEDDCVDFRHNATTVGVPDMLSSSSGVLYYEIEIGRPCNPAISMEPRFKFGFSGVDGIRVCTDGLARNGTVGDGDNARSWGFCGFTGYKIHVGDVLGDHTSTGRWGPGSVVGIAANLDKGMIAVSVHGNWDLLNGNGVKFEDEAIKSGVYPCISGGALCPQLVCRFADFKHGLPPSSLWETWPRYEDDTWLGLTEEARAAAIVLGYTQQSWISSSSSPSNPIEKKAWDELNDRENEAAITLGYNANIWSQITKLWSCDVDDGESSGSDSDDESLTSHFASMSWDELPGDVRRAAETLGYTENSWNEDEDGPLDDKMWNELTSQQQNAAIVLGYDENSWNEDSESDDSDMSDCDLSASIENGGLPFDHLSWDELPSNAKEAAEKLGHSAETWDQNMTSSWDNTPYEELPMEQQFAATILGYSAEKWNRVINEALDLASMLFLGQPRQR